jgi:hypothetical protein
MYNKRKRERERRREKRERWEKRGEVEGEVQKLNLNDTLVERIRSNNGRKENK